jgi:formate hydrogenlyase transcriptional activator
LEGEVLQLRKNSSEEVFRTGNPIHFYDEREGKYFENNIYPVFDTDGDNVVSLAIFASDISKRKKAELALIKSESKLREAHKIGKIGIWEWDIVAHKGYYSEEVFKIFDIDPDPDTKIVSDKMIEIIHPEDRERHDYITMNLFNKKVVNEPYDYRIIHRDGTIRHVFTDVNIKFDTDGNPLTIGGIVQDVTERKLAELGKEKLLHDIGERLKELTCLYSISDSIKARKTLEQVFQDTLDAIPLGWHYPEITRGRLIFNNKEFVAEPFEETTWKQSSDIIIDGKKEGELEVYFLEEKPILDEGPFMKEERNLINNIAHTLSQAIEHLQANQALKKEAEFQKIVAKISTLFINLPTNKIDEAINEQFKEIGEFFNADRVTIGKLNGKGELLSATNMWFSDKIDGEKLATAMIGTTYPNLVNHLKDKEYWSFSDPDDFSPWHPERETVGKMPFKSGLIIVTSFEKPIIELFVIDFTQSNRVWTKNIIEQVKLLGNAFSNALNRKRAEEALLKETEFKQLVSETSSRFIGLSGVEFEAAIQNSLSEISIYFKADAVRLFSLSLQGEILKQRFIWQSEHLQPAGELAQINSMVYPNFATHFSKGKSVVFNKFIDSPDWPNIRKIIKFSGIKAGIGVPLESDKFGVDIFTMGNVVSGHQWPKDIIEKSKTIGQALLNAILRNEAEVEIQKGYSEIKQLKYQLLQENIYLKEEIKGITNFDTIIGQSKALKYVLFRVEQVAPTDTTVLISGETGTGKELFTNSLHQLSLRKNKSMVKVNCAALSPTLIESELFGHERGAFTGANEKRIGRFELADGGTIFLDEIGELSLEIQAKLLRVLQEGEFERLGSSKTIKVNVRIIAATNRNLEEEVKKNSFRVDLYYRLTTFIITIPPLRDRKEDIPLLVRFLVNKLEKKFNKSIKKIPQGLMRKLVNYSWPGNVRELENVIENGLIISNGEVLKAEVPGNIGLGSLEKSKLEDFEREHIIKVLESVDWQIGGKDGAAERLGLKRTTLNSKMKKLNIEKTSR